MVVALPAVQGSVVVTLFWTVDEDGETIHRLAREWDGNHAPWKEWGNYESETKNWQLAIGATWSHWGLGPEADWSRWATWVYKENKRVPTRTWTVSFTLGPWYVSWTRISPVKEKELVRG